MEGHRRRVPRAYRRSTSRRSHDRGSRHRKRGDRIGILAKDLATPATELDRLRRAESVPRVDAEAVRVVPVAQVRSIRYLPGDQRLDAAITDPVGGTATVSSVYSAASPGALDARRCLARCTLRLRRNTPGPRRTRHRSPRPGHQSAHNGARSQSPTRASPTTWPCSPARPRASPTTRARTHSPDRTWATNSPTRQVIQGLLREHAIRRVQRLHLRQLCAQAQPVGQLQQRARIEQPALRRLPHQPSATCPRCRSSYRTCATCMTAVSRRVTRG